MEIAALDECLREYADLILEGTTLDGVLVLGITDGVAEFAAVTREDADQQSKDMGMAVADAIHTALKSENDGQTLRIGGGAPTA